MEYEPNIEPGLSVGKLICEEGDVIDVFPDESRIHFFMDGSYPCIELLDYENKDEVVYRVTTHGILDVVGEYGIPMQTHLDDTGFRNRARIAINPEEKRLYEWDFHPEGAWQSIGQEALELIRDEGLDRELDEPRFFLGTEEGERELTKEQTLLVTVEDKPLLSHVVVSNSDETNSCYPLHEEVIEQMQAVEFHRVSLESSAIPSRVQEDLIRQLLKKVDLSTLL